MKILFISLLIACVSVVNAANFHRADGVTEKEWDNKSPMVFGYLTLPPLNDNNCQWDGDGDLALNFDISVLSRLAGSAFDVNKLYFDGVTAGEWALDAWFLSWGGVATSHP